MLRSFRVLCGLLVLFFWAGITHALQAADDNATSSSPAAASQAAPSISIPENVYDFGEVMEGGEAFHDFIVKNTGEAPLQIKRVRSG